MAAVSPIVQVAPAEVEILRNTNVREGLPSSMVPVVRVLLSGAKVKVRGFTSRGEMVKGNSSFRHGLKLTGRQETAEGLVDYLAAALRR